jgi:hypothetical protein
VEETRVVDALVSVGGRYAGRLPEFKVDGPWWSDVEGVTRHVDEALGGRAVVLRLMHADEAAIGRGGRVVYHVQAMGDPRSAVLDAAELPDWDSVGHPLRATWAEVDGPQELIEWAAGIVGTAEWTQVKTWNLSCLIRFATDDGGAWAKATSTFCSVDADVIAQVRLYDARLVPVVLGVDLENRWSLLRHVPGNDCWEPDRATVQDVVSRWVAVQAAMAAEVDELRTPRMVPGDLADELTGLLAGEVGERLTADELVEARRLVDELPAIVARLESAGLPITLVHGDFHPGNWRSDGTTGRIMDWADSYVGHPATDIERLRGWLPAEKQDHAVETWAAAWKRRLPGCEPLLALEPIKVIARILGAVTYQRFLDNIETSERIYHEDDPTSEVRAAIEAAKTLVLGQTADA